MKRLGVALFISLFLFSIVASTFVLAADTDIKTYTSSSFLSYFTNFLNFKARWNLWLGGANYNSYICDGPLTCINQKDQTSCEAHKPTGDSYKDIDPSVNPICTWKTQGKMVAEIMKVFMLILVIILSYSAFKYANFPENAILRFIIAIAVGFLGTFAITTAELITALQSYSALGITFTLFLPVLILGFFTLVIADKGSPLGIYFQKIMWLIYSAYLAIKSLILFILIQSFDPVAKEVFLSPTVKSIIDPFVMQGTVANIKAGMYDQTILVIHIIVAIAVLVIMVFSNKPVLAWLAHEKLDSEVQSQKQKLERSSEYDKMRAEQMQKG